jgi:hypothetical protein
MGWGACRNGWMAAIIAEKKPAGTAAPRLALGVS